MHRGPGRDLVAWYSALLYDTILVQPVLCEFEHLDAPTLWLVGQRDTTAVAKDLAPAELATRLGDCPRLGRQAAAPIPHATPAEFADAGHAPQLRADDVFQRALRDGLAALPGAHTASD